MKAPLKTTFWRAGALLFCIAGLPLARAARADQAIVVGINEYKGFLPDEWLKGCIDDADLMEKVLQKRGFTVNKLVDTKATHQGIAAMFAKISKSIKPNERFVFYFAGHGAQRGYLLTSDTTRRGVNALTSEELKGMALQIQAKSRTVILDACYSESLITTRGLKDPDTKTRAIRLVGVPDEDVRASEATHGVDEGTRDVNSDGKPGAALPGKEKPKDNAAICYWTAAMRTEKANECTLPTLTNGKKHGVFTYYAAQELSKGAQTWGKMNDEVRKLIEKTHEQSPVITQSFTNTTACEPKQEPKPIEGNPQSSPVLPALKTVWDAFNHEHVNAQFLKLRVDPDKSVVAKDQELNMSVDTGFEGYLVVMDMDANGEVFLAYPKSRMVQDAKIEAGKNIKPWQSANMDEAGRFQVRALLIHSEKLASDLIAQFPETRILKKKSLVSRHLNFEDKMAPDEYYTADLLFQVNDSVKPAKTDAP